MIEREMEDLIANYPDEFFPDKRFQLKGRQKSFAGVGRFDLLFQDAHKTNILVELKAVPAKYEVADQLAKYKDELQRQGHSDIWMWLIAPQICTSVREFLDRIGIEYREIHFGEFRRVALSRGFTLINETSGDNREYGQAKAVPQEPRLTPPRSTSPQIETGPRVTIPSSFRWRAFGYDLHLLNPQSFDEAHFGTLIDQFERAVPSQRNAAVINELRRWSANPDSMRWPLKSNQSLLRWVTTSSYKSVVPHALALWKYLFGEPAPTWYVWTQSRGYEFDADGWREWYESLQPQP